MAETKREMARRIAADAIENSPLGADPKLQMARQACASACDDPAWRPEIVAGKCDDWLGVRAALAAIEECTERAAKLLRACAAEEVSAAIVVEAWGEYYADAISRGDHLKGPTE